jgi:stage IV sporulation protein FB
MNTEHTWNWGRWAGIPVSMHWTVLLAFPWLFLYMRDLLGALIGTLAFIGLLLAHQFGHVVLARWRRVRVESILLTFWHGQTELGYAKSPWDEVLVAWGGVLAQLIILGLAYVCEPLLLETQSSLLLRVVVPILTVFTQWNLFLILVALLPLGPLDGPVAWRVFPLLRQKLQRRRRNAEKRRQWEAQSRKVADDIIKNLGRDKVDRE